MKRIRSREKITPEQMELLKEFEAILLTYEPNWEHIAKTNQAYKKLSAYEAQKQRLEIFCERMNELRENHELSLRSFGEMCGLSHSHMHTISLKKLPTIPYNNLERIAEAFHISIAYLLGLVDSPDYMPNLAEMYLWEYPECKFTTCRKLAIKNLDYSGRRSMITILSLPFEELQKEMIEWMKNDVKLADIIHDLLSAPEPKRSQYIKILDELRKI